MPKVSIIVPVYNEAAHVRACIDSITNGTFQDFELIVADGGSIDGTLSILKELASKDPRVVVTDNPKKHQVFALNEMIEMASAAVIVRCDAHAIYPNDYIERIYGHLVSSVRYGNVGTCSVCVPSDNSSKSAGISVALSNPFGVGLSHRNCFHSAETREVDTLLFGAWRAAIFEDVGVFDTDFLRGQDYEHNLRLRENDYKIIQVSGEPLKYLARSSLSKLFKMIMQYASCKPLLIRKYRRFPNYRFCVPLIFFLVLLGLLIVAPSLGVLIVVAYILTLFVVSFFSIRSRKIDTPFIETLVFSAISMIVAHVAHAVGTLFGIGWAFGLVGHEIQSANSR